MRAGPAGLRRVSGRGNRRENVRSARDVLPQSVQFSVAIDIDLLAHSAVESRDNNASNVSAFVVPTARTVPRAVHRRGNARATWIPVQPPRPRCHDTSPNEIAPARTWPADLPPRHWPRARACPQPLASAHPPTPIDRTPKGPQTRFGRNSGFNRHASKPHARHRGEGMGPPDPTDCCLQVQPPAPRRSPACRPGTTRVPRSPTAPGPAPGASPGTGTLRKSRPAGSRTSKPSGATRHKSHANRHIPRNSKALGAGPQTGLKYPERPRSGS